MQTYCTHKDRFSQDWLSKSRSDYWYYNRRRGWKRALKRATAKANRLRPITDETAYKRLADRWNYD